MKVYEEKRDYFVFEMEYLLERQNSKGYGYSPLAKYITSLDLYNAPHLDSWFVAGGSLRHLFAPSFRTSKVLKGNVEYQNFGVNDLDIFFKGIPSSTRDGELLV